MPTPTARSSAASFAHAISVIRAATLLAEIGDYRDRYPHRDAGWDATPTPVPPPPAAVRPARRPGEIATTSTSKHTIASHNAVIPRSSCANVSPSNALPASSAIRRSCFSDAQSIPAQLPIKLSFGTGSTAPDPEVALRVLIDKALNWG